VHANNDFAIIMASENGPICWMQARTCMQIMVTQSEWLPIMDSLVHY